MISVVLLQTFTKCASDSELTALQGIRNSDAIVIETALTLFFSNQKPYNYYNEGEFVGLQPKYGSGDHSFFREPYINLVKGIPAQAFDHQLPKIEKLVQRINEKSHFDSGPLTPLERLDLGPRIVVTTERFRLSMSDNPKVRNAQGKLGALRVGGQLSPVAYSKDGSIAIVQIKGVNWGRHSSEYYFALSRTSGKWKVIYASWQVWL